MGGTQATDAIERGRRVSVPGRPGWLLQPLFSWNFHGKLRPWPVPRVVDLAGHGRKPRSTSLFLLHGAFPGLQEMLGFIPLASGNVHDLVPEDLQLLRNPRGDFQGRLWRFYHTGDWSDLLTGWEPRGD